MIISEYQGIGKSTLSKNKSNVIDLESSNFYVDGERFSKWADVYCKIAKSLSDQGYVVFISSHKIVRNKLKRMDYDNIYLCYPSIDLEYPWIERLFKRYKESNLDKDYNAWINAKDMFSFNIIDIEKDSEYFKGKIVLKSMEYDLKTLVEECEYGKKVISFEDLSFSSDLIDRISRIHKTPDVMPFRDAIEKLKQGHTIYQIDNDSTFIHLNDDKEIIAIDIYKQQIYEYSFTNDDLFCNKWHSIGNRGTSSFKILSDVNIYVFQKHCKRIYER